MANAKGEWIIPFLDDLREFAEEQEMSELAADLSELIDRHGPSLVPSSGESRECRRTADIFDLGLRSKPSGNLRKAH